MADYYLKTDNIMKNMFTVALKDELAAQSQMGKVRLATEAMLQKVRSYELSEKRLPITTGEQRELRNALNRLRDKYLAMGRYSYECGIPKEQGSAWTLWTSRGCRGDYKERWSLLMIPGRFTCIGQMEEVLP